MKTSSWVCLGLAVCIVVLTAGCRNNPQPQTPPKTEEDRGIDTSEEMWAENVSRDGDAFEVTVTVRVKDTLANAKTDATEECFRKAVDMAVKDYLRDISKYDANADEINRQILNQASKYMKSNSVVQTKTFNNDKQYGMRMRVVINDQALKNVLQDLGMIRQNIAERKIIIVVYGGKNADKELTADLGRKLGEFYNRQGYNAVLWDEIATDIAEERNVGDRATEAFIQKFVENPEFQGDTEYQGTLTALRSRGRVVVGFNVIKVAVQNRTVNVGVKAFAKDLLTGRIFADVQKPGTRLLAADADRDIAISETLYKTAEECSAEVVKKTNDWYDKLERQKAGTEYTFKFSGFTEDEVQQIDKQWRQTFASGGDGNMESGTYVRTYTGEEKAGELCDKVDMMLKKGGLKARKPLPDSRATTFEFKKQ